MKHRTQQIVAVTLLVAFCIFLFRLPFYLSRRTVGGPASGTQQIEMELSNRVAAGAEG